MKTSKHRLLSLVLALIMVLGSISPSLATEATSPENSDTNKTPTETTTVKVTFSFLKDGQEIKAEEWAELKLAEKLSLTKLDKEGKKLEDGRVSFQTDGQTLTFQGEKNSQYKLDYQGDGVLEGKTIPVDLTYKDQILHIKENSQGNEVKFNLVTQRYLQVTAPTYKKDGRDHLVTITVKDAQGKELATSDKGYALKLGQEYTIKASAPGFEVRQDYLDASNGVLGLKADAKNEFKLSITSDSTLQLIVVDPNLKLKSLGTYGAGTRIIKGYAPVEQKDQEVQILRQNKKQWEKLGSTSTLTKGTIKADGNFLFGTASDLVLKETIQAYFVTKDQITSALSSHKVEKKGLPFTLEAVFVGDKKLKGQFDKDQLGKIASGEVDKLTLTIYKLDAKGNREENPSIYKYRGAANLVSSFDLDADKKFELNYIVPFEKDTRYQVLASIGDDYETLLDFTPLAKTEVKRVAGDTRYQTAVEIAKAAYEKADTIILASGLDQASADALAAGPLANVLDAPILLATKDSIHKEALAYIKDAEAKNILIVGGSNSLSDRVLAAVKKELPSIKAERIWGQNRFETSVKIAQRLVDKHGFSKDQALLANGLIDADALAVSRYAEVKKLPILLTRSNLLPAEVKAYLKDKGISQVQVVGGKATIQDKVVTDNKLKIAKRLAGADRYATSLEVAKELQDLKALVLANGFKAPDALTATALAKTQEGTILLVKNPLVVKDNKTLEWIKEKKISQLFLVGGKASIGDSSKTILEELVNEIVRADKSQASDQDQAKAE